MDEVRNRSLEIINTENNKSNNLSDSCGTKEVIVQQSNSEKNESCTVSGEILESSLENGFEKTSSFSDQCDNSWENEVSNKLSEYKDKEIKSDIHTNNKDLSISEMEREDPLVSNDELSQLDEAFLESKGSNDINNEVSSKSTDVGNEDELIYKSIEENEESNDIDDEVASKSVDIEDVRNEEQLISEKEENPGDTFSQINKVLQSEETDNLLLDSGAPTSEIDELLDTKDCDGQLIEGNNPMDAENSDLQSATENSFVSESSNKQSLKCNEAEEIGNLNVQSNKCEDISNVEAEEDQPMSKLCIDEGPKNETIIKKSPKNKIKIKLRSFASLCEDDSPDTPESPISKDLNSELSSFTVGDIVEHSKYVESDESGVMHLKISNVVGGEDCITGISFDEGTDTSLQISSVTSLVESFSSDDVKGNNRNFPGVDNYLPDSDKSLADDERNTTDEETECSFKEIELNDSKSIGGTIVNVYKSTLVVSKSCLCCKKRALCMFRIMFRSAHAGSNVSFICSAKCKNNFFVNLPYNHTLQKPKHCFERFCGNCGKELPIKNDLDQTLSWQTREFCDKLCLADHIGEVARSCFYCKSSVRVIFMVKYCVRFGSDIHQFCCNSCLEMYKTTIKVCSFCQKNLCTVEKIISPSSKEYCSSKCLKRAQRRDIGQMNYRDQIPCTVCLKTLVNRYEFLHNSSAAYLCSIPCLNVFKYVNKVKSVNCCLCSRLMNAEDASNYFFFGKQLKVFCSESCFSVFIISARKIVTCKYCKVKKYNFDMIWSRADSEKEYFSCSYCCLNFVDNSNSKITLGDENPMKNSQPVNLNDNLEESVTEKIEAVEENRPITSDKSVPDHPTQNAQNTLQSGMDSQASVAPFVKHCSMCDKLEAALFHMVMSDNTLRSFCSYVCAAEYKRSFGFQVSGGLQAASSGKATPAPESSTELKKNKVSTYTSTSVVSSQSADKVDLKDIKAIIKGLRPPIVSNKSVSCHPLVKTKSTQCYIGIIGNKPSEKEKEEPSKEPPKAVLPFPLPVFVPTPMMMYSASTPVPLIVPIPIPIPVFVPTNEKTTKDIHSKVKSILKDFSEFERRRKRNKKDDDSEEIDCEDSEINLMEKIQLNLSEFVLKPREKCNDEELESSPRSSSPPAKRFKSDDDTSLETELCLKIWRSWFRRKLDLTSPDAESIDQAMLNLSTKKLCCHLTEFLVDISSHTPKFDADVIFYVLLGIQKYLFERGSLNYIFLEVNFDLFSVYFNDVIEKHFQLVSSPMMKTLNSTRVSEEMLWDAKLLGAHTPHVLLNTLFYFNTKFFKLKSSFDHFNLGFDKIVKKTKVCEDSSTTISRLYYSKDGAKDITDNEDGDLVFMEENRGNPLRCPVKHFEFYLSKCPSQLRGEKEIYYVYPERTCHPDSPSWFSSDFIEVRTLDKMLNRFLLVKEVQEALYPS